MAGKHGPKNVAFAAQLMKSGQANAAESLCRQLVTKNPRDADAFHLLGVLLAQRGAVQEAASAMERALKVQPRVLRLWLNLAALLTEHEPARAAECYRRALELDPRSREARGALATLLEKSEQYEEAATQLRELLKSSPEDSQAMFLLATVLHRGKMHEEEVQTAHELLRRRPGDREIRRMLGRAYELWRQSVKGDSEKELAVVERWLQFDPVEQIALARKGLLTGAATPDRATRAYVERHFDDFSADFDATLTHLKYQGPQAVGAMMSETLLADARPRILDIGCGTGRLAPIIGARKSALVGVDLSKGMLEVARKNGGYDELVQADALDFLRERPHAFDAVAVVDTLIYFGNLEALFLGIASALVTGGLVFGTIELLDEGGKPFELHEAGRYAHTRSYLASVLDEAGIPLGKTAVLTLREEFDQPVQGLAFVAGPKPG